MLLTLLQNSKKEFVKNLQIRTNKQFSLNLTLILLLSLFVTYNSRLVYIQSGNFV